MIAKQGSSYRYSPCVVQTLLVGVDVPKLSNFAWFDDEILKCRSEQMSAARISKDCVAQSGYQFVDSEMAISISFSANIVTNCVVRLCDRPG